MKNLIIVSGSARKGNSNYIAQKIFETSQQRVGLKVEIINLTDYRIDYCDGCLLCDQTGSCHKSDDMSLLLEKIKETDGVIFISPTRWSLISGDLKVFFDRWNPLAGKKIFDSKKCFNICIGQTEMKNSVSISRALKSLKFFVEDAGFNMKGQFAFENCYEADAASKDALRIKKLEEEIISFINKL